MKKLMIATAIAASIASGANAFTTYDVTSSITSAQLWLPIGASVPPGTDVLAAGATVTGLAIGGFAYDVDSNGTIDAGQLTFHGQTIFNAGPLIRVTYDLSGGDYSTSAPAGITFKAGTVQIDAYSTTSGWLPYSTIDVATTNIPFVAGTGTGHLGTNNTAGITNLAPGTVSLPGLFTPPSGIDNAVSGITLLGNAAGMFLSGTVTLTP
jgi:hypothetical protein